MCGVEKDLIFEALTVDSLPKIFVALQKQKVNLRVQKWFGIKKTKTAKLSEWKRLINIVQSKKGTVKIGLVAKYLGNNDPYLSVFEALKSAAHFYKFGVQIKIIGAEKLEQLKSEARQVYVELKNDNHAR